MKAPTKEELINAIDRSVEELHRHIEMHHCLMTSILGQRVGERGLKALPLALRSPYEEKMKRAIEEAIVTLEESRKAFKSKRLEALRKRLTKVLIESA